MSFWHKLCALLLVGLLGVSLAVVHMSHRARKLTGEISQSQSQSHKLETSFRQLQLERAQWSTSSRVEKIAREQLRMQFPDATRTIHLTGAQIAGFHTPSPLSASLQKSTPNIPPGAKP